MKGPGAALRQWQQNDKTLQQNRKVFFYDAATFGIYHQGRKSGDHFLRHGSIKNGVSELLTGFYIWCTALFRS